ncbi:MAG: CDP-diacylglycerol--glycerol-3-phosphate 3-phosphatidyltransferase [Rickettsiales bacterium]|nr:CDP-diacylglycerol--glycerol-3-phosphate 3-phosphatidyltransferase [Rickettsiales bacterium]
MILKQNIPNYLTALRIAIIPLMLAVFVIPDGIGNVVAAGLFVLASISDFFDGYLARKWNVQSSMGRFLDPIADKLLIAAILILLVDARVVEGWHILPAIAILCREILVSGLREFLAEVKVVVPVTNLAKWKTGVQMGALFFMLLGPITPLWLGGDSFGLLLLWLAATLTLYTGYNYLVQGLKHF